MNELTKLPALVFGSSTGALIGLDLALRYPKQVRLLVAHEPPVEGLLPDFVLLQEEIHQTSIREGSLVAMYKLARQLNLDYSDLEPGVVLPQRDARSAYSNNFGFTFLAVHHYRLDVDALKAAAMPVVLAGGSTGTIQAIAAQQPWQNVSEKLWLNFPVTTPVISATRTLSQPGCMRFYKVRMNNNLKY